MTNEINRREALRRTAYLMGGALMAPTIVGILQGCSAQPELAWTPTFFTEPQARLVTILSDIILPKTDTPSASELGVPGFIEQIIAKVAKEKQRTQFMEAMNTFETECKEVEGKVFINLSAEKQLAFAMKKHEEIVAGGYTSDQKPFLHMMKELSITGYFTTEVGMTQVLQYVAIPTEYKGCISLQEAGGKTWAT